MFPIVISARRLAWIARCERRLWLDRHTDPSQAVGLTPEAQERAEQGLAHEEALAQAALTRVAVLPDVSWPERVALTQSLLHAGVPALRNAALEAVLGESLSVYGDVDLLLRHEEPSALGDWSYLPVEIKLHGEPRAEDWLQLDVYRYLVGVAQGLVPPGELWLGANGLKPRRRLVRQADLAELELAAQRLIEVSGAAQAPAVWFERSCIFCPWRIACQTAAQQTGDLALLPQLERRSADALRAVGINHLDQVATLIPVRLAALAKVGEGQATRLLAWAQALQSGVAVRLAAQAGMGAEPLFVDIETHPTTHEPWALGWLAAGGKAGMALVVESEPAAHIAPFEFGDTTVAVAGSIEQAWGLVAQAASGNGPVVHWGDTERTLLRQHAPHELRVTLLPRFTDAHRLLTGRWALPIARAPERSSGSLKAVGAWLGARWPAGGDHWREAWRAFSAWQHQPTNHATLAPAIGYLQADLKALQVVWDWLAAQVTID